MKRIMAAILTVVMALTGLTGCGKTEPQPMIPETPEPPGTLVGMTYATGGGMVAHSDFYIRVSQKEIEHTEFWPEDVYVDAIQVGEHIPVTQQQWEDVEAVILDLYRDGKLEAYQPKPKPESNPMDVFVLDGGDYTNLSLVWETENGPEEMSYYWPNDRRVLTLIDLLRELADPRGREITWYESPRLDEIYFTRKHRFNKDRDFSFQLHWTEYEGEEPHWELIYYLGKYGAVDKGHIQLTETDWDHFTAFAEDLQLEYFPEQTKSDDFFKCHLVYTDGQYKNVVLNKETEELLAAYFMKLVQQHQ